MLYDPPGRVVELNGVTTVFFGLYSNSGALCLWATGHSSCSRPLAGKGILGVLQTLRDDAVAGLVKESGDKSTHSAFVRSYVRTYVRA